jgi:hypothetical protein
MTSRCFIPVLSNRERIGDLRSGPLHATRSSRPALAAAPMLGRQVFRRAGVGEDVVERYEPPPFDRIPSLRQHPAAALIAALIGSVVTTGDAQAEDAADDAALEDHEITDLGLERRHRYHHSQG